MTTPSRLRPLEVGHQAVAVRAGHHLDQLPAVLAPVVEDLLGGVDHQRNRGVLPLRHAVTVGRWSAPATRGVSPARCDSIPPLTCHACPVEKNWLDDNWVWLLVRGIIAIL